MSAHVRDIEAIQRFRVALLKFAEEAEAAYAMMMMETQRTIDWIEQDRPHYWQGQVRRGFDQVAAARTTLHRAQMITVAGHRKACIDEKQALANAKRRLEFCQQQIDRVRHWSIKIRHDTDEFRGRLSGLRRLLDGDIPKGAALLAKTVEVLERYAGISRPTTSGDE